MIILISGKQGSGKTSLSESLMTRLESVAGTKFAQVLYEMHYAVLKIANRCGFDIKLDKRLLQILGTEWARGIDQNFWVKCAIKEVEKFYAEGFKLVIIDDCRFKNEFELEGAIKIRLECPAEVRKERCSQWRDNENHQSEIDLDDWVDRFDLVINTEHTTKEETLNLALGYIHERIFNSTRV